METSIEKRVAELENLVFLSKNVLSGSASNGAGELPEE